MRRHGSDAKLWNYGFLFDIVTAERHRLAIRDGSGFMSTRERKCTGGLGLFLEPIEPRILFASPAVDLHINFQAPTTKAIFAGYAADTGAKYGAKSGGLTFGWSSTNTSNARQRNSKS